MEDIPEAACLGFLKRHRVGVMALAEQGRAYAVPLFYAYDGKRLYFQSHPGEKDHYLASSQQACFVVTEVRDDDHWSSVQVQGTVEKITLSDDAVAALNAMERNPFPPEFGSDEAGMPKRSSTKMYLWMLTPSHVSGRRSRVAG